MQYIYAGSQAMTAAQSLKIYEILNRQFGKPEKTLQVVEAIEAVVSEKTEEGNKRYETLLHKDIDLLRLERAEKITRSEGSLRAEMKEQKSELIKWMFVFWIGQIAAPIGIILLFIKK